MEKTLTKVKSSTNALILNLFGKAVVTENNTSYVALNKKAAVAGYLVHPNLSNKGVLDWILSKKANYGTTFYKNWGSVISGKFDLWEEACKHYTSTYGTDFKGKTYVVNDGAEVPDFTSLKVIMPIEISEVIDRCRGMLYSGIALKQETIDAIFAILDDFSTSQNGDGAVNYLDINKVKNKEAKLYLYKRLNLVPSDSTEMVRYLIYLATGKSLLIKDKQTLSLIEASKFNFNELVDAYGIANLSSVFYRFKPIFLAFKKANRKNKSIVNALRKLAEKNHEPYQHGFLENLLSRKNVDLEALAERLKTATNFTKVKLLQTINVRNKFLNLNAFGIRNQKLFIKENAVPKHGVGQYDAIYKIIYASLVESLSQKACNVTIPNGVNIKLPTSEKSFIGNYPLGTSFDFSETDNIVGINWRGEDGANDLDLSLMAIDGKKYGWNSDYYNDRRSVIYSGDMTRAYPEATELFYTSKEFTPSIVKVNLFNGAPNSKFKFFLAKEKITKMNSNYMVDPNNIVVNVDCEMDSREKMLGVITDKQFILAQFRTGRGMVAYHSVTDKYTEYALSTLDCYISLWEVLVDAGFKIVDEGADVDLRNLSKDTLINLLS